MPPQSSETLGVYDDLLPDAVFTEVPTKPDVWRLRIFFIILLLVVTTAVVLLSPVVPKWVCMHKCLNKRRTRPILLELTSLHLE
jgi:hypothetical protein